MYDGKGSFTYVKDVAVGRALPNIFRISDDDAMIISYQNNKGDTLSSVVVDRLKGDTMHIPLLEEWHPLVYVNHSDAESSISDASMLGAYLPITCQQ